MPVPSSGPLELYGDIQVEIGGAQADTSLKSMSDDASKSGAMSDFYGYSSVVLASVNTCNAQQNIPDNVRIRGYVNSTGGAATICRGFRFGPYSNINSNTSYTNSTSAGTGMYCYDGSTQQNNTYYWHAWAENAAGRATGNTCNVTTPSCFTPLLNETISNSTFGCIVNTKCICTQATTSYQHPYLGNTTTCSTSRGWQGSNITSEQSGTVACNPGITSRNTTKITWFDGHQQTTYPRPNTLQNGCGFYLGCMTSGQISTPSNNVCVTWGCCNRSGNVMNFYLKNSDYNVRAYRTHACSTGQA